MSALAEIWFILIFVLLIVYAILDGFDLGVGVLHLFARNDTERRLGLNAVGPVWDGNEVWLLTGGGALFAAFPPVYAMFGEGFYLAIMLLLTALIFRAVSFEFRGKVDSPAWKRVWDMAFALGSLLAALLLGVAFGNVLRGLPIDADGRFVGTFLQLLNPFALLVGLLGLAMFTMHGAAYMTCKTEGDLQRRMRHWVGPMWVIAVVLYVAVSIYAFFDAPHLLDNVIDRPVAWVLGALVMVGLIYIPVALRAHRDGQTLAATGLFIACGLGQGAVALFPNMIPSRLDPAASLTIANSANTALTLKTMLIIALIGVPLVLIYTAAIYWIFRGKVKLTEHSY